MAEQQAGLGQPDNGFGYLRKGLFWIGTGAVLCVVVYPIAAVGQASRPMVEATGISPVVWLLLAAQIALTFWVYRSNVRHTAERPPPAWRVSFHYSGLMIAFVMAVVAIAFATPSLFPEDFRILITAVTVAGLLQFLTIGRLLDVWRSFAKLRLEVGIFVVQVSIYWAVVVVFLGATLLRIKAEELTTDALVAASVLTLPLVGSIHWNLREQMISRPRPPEGGTRGDRPPTSSSGRVRAPARAWAFGLIVFVIARGVAKRAIVRRVAGTDEYQAHEGHAVGATRRARR